MTGKTTRSDKEKQDVLDAPQVQLGQSDIDNQTDNEEQADRDLVNEALSVQADRKAAAAKASAEAIKKGEEALNKQQNATKKKASAKVTRFYLADPLRQTRIRRPNSAYMLRFRNGVLSVDNDEDAELVRKALRGAVYEEDFPEDKAAPVCETCGYAPRSFAAFAAHQKTHPANI